MPWIQKTFTLRSRARGFHLITGEILAALPELAGIHVGLLHLFIQHTSASLTINENADPDVRKDMEEHLRRLMPDNAPHYLHEAEGPDDMPGHLKSSVLGCSLTIPVTGGRLNLGIWQGVYLGEHRDDARGRHIVATIMGE
ncbi:MAG: YjbQ family protein [Ignavibacteriae bacterium]|nr:YjbQ family protein [Ignavibacteriota bacterium]